MGKNKIILGIAAIAVASSIMTTVFAGTGTNGDPGSIEDPIVTKSYVDEQINILKQQNLGGGGEATALTVVKMGPGEILIGEAGTEIIVRSGKVVAHGPGANGIPDVTGGLDIAIGKPIALNHLLIIPANDGRGIKILDGTSYVMVRGGFEKQ